MAIPGAVSRDGGVSLARIAARWPRRRRRVHGPPRQRGAERCGAARRVEAEISLSALRYPTFPDVAKQNGSHTRQALPDSRSRLLFHSVGVRPASDLLSILSRPVKIVFALLLFHLSRAPPRSLSPCLPVIAARFN